MQRLKWPVRATGLAALWIFFCPSGCSNDSQASGSAEAAPAATWRRAARQAVTRKSASKTMTKATTSVQTKLKIKGMTCVGCAADVSNTLKAIPGVKTADVNFQEGSALVVHDNAKAKAADLIKAVNGITHYGRKGAFHAIEKTKPNKTSERH